MTVKFEHWSLLGDYFRKAGQRLEDDSPHSLEYALNGLGFEAMSAQRT